jgi:predicted TIM-barrel fold metal-dependent hydrolase
MTDVRAHERQAAEPPAAVSLVDCDVHPMIPHAELQARLSTRWRRHLERFGRRTPIVTEFYPRASNAGFRVDSWPPTGLPGSDLELLRRQLLDEYGIDYGILNSLAMTGVHEVPELAAEIARALNDWMWEWMDEDSRLLGAIVVAHEYPVLAVREIERCAADARWVQVLLPDSAEEPLGSLKYRSIFEAAAAHGLPVGIHTAGFAPHGGTGWPSYYLEEHVGNAFQMQSQLTNMVCEGLFEALPDLRLVLTESGVAWSISLGWAIDSAWELLRDEVPALERRPSETIREQVWFTTQPIEEPDDPADFARALEHGDLADRLLFASDYPHWDFDSPSQALPASVTPDLRRKILAGNASALYRLPFENCAA